MNRIKTVAYLAITFLALASLIVFPQEVIKFASEESSKPAPTPFDSLVLQAKSVFVYDTVTQKAMYMKNAFEPQPLASLTKIMTALTAVDTAPKSTLVTINGDDLASEGDSGLYVGEQWSLSNLLKFTLVVSSNDGAAAVASALGKPEADDGVSRSEFVKRMNKEAAALGLTSMQFNNESGLDVSETQAGAYGSAKDVAKLFAKAVLLHPDIFAPTRKPEIILTSADNISHEATNTDILTTKLNGFIAGKTGYTDLAGGNLAIAFNPVPSHPIIIVVLGSTIDGRFNDVEKLAGAATKMISTKAQNTGIGTN